MKHRTDPATAPRHAAFPQCLRRASLTAISVVFIVALTAAPRSCGSVARSPGQQQIQAVVSAPVVISPGQPIQAVVDAQPAGTSFLLKAGTYRMQTVTPKSGDSFTGEAGAIMSGAQELTSFWRSGSYWAASGLTGQRSAQGQCDPGYGGCAYANDLYFDNLPLRHVLTLGEVAPGAWYFDYVASTLYFADDPTGHQVEWSTTRDAFNGTASNVTISSLVIEKYANPAQHGAVHSDATTGWVVQNTEVRLTHGVGIRVSASSRILNNNVHHNGQMGLGGADCKTLLIQGNELAYNNTLHFNPDWEAGGAKFVKTDGLVVRGNFSHHNRGAGLWTDTDNINTVYEQNTVEDNDRAGIFHEISYSAVIRNNTVRRNGFAFSAWLWGAGILVAASPDVEIDGNTVENNANGIAGVQQNRGSGAYGAHELNNLWVHDNNVTMASGRTGVAQDIGDSSYFTSRNNRFDLNTYRLGTNARYFEWMNGPRAEAEWRGYGEDANGTFIR